MPFDGAIAPLETKRQKLEYTRDVVIPNINMNKLDMQFWEDCLCGHMMKDARLNTTREIGPHSFSEGVIGLNPYERGILFSNDECTREQLVARVEQVLSALPA